MDSEQKEAKRARDKYFTVLLGCIGILVLIAIIMPHGIVCGTRSKVSWVKADQRTLATALEAYYADHQSTYPAWTTDPKWSANGHLAGRAPILAKLPTFRNANGTGLMTLTTPTAYLAAYFVDPYAPVKGATFCYWANKSDAATYHSDGWIVWSAGPDRKYGQGR